MGWIVLNQFRGHLDLHLGERSGLVAKGYIGAGLYLVAFGFLAARFYERAASQRRLRYSALVWRTFRALFPVHLAAFAFLGALVTLGQLSQTPLTNGNFALTEAVGQVLMLQAWGVVRHDSWNFPTWLVSAVWAGCLLLPIVVGLGRRIGGRPLIILAYVIFFGLFAFTTHLGLLLTDLTTYGAVQMVPALFLGAGIYYVGTNTLRLPSIAIWAGTISGLWVLLASTLRFSDALIWPAFGVIVWAAAEIARFRSHLLAGPTADHLGRLAISVMVFYLPTEIAYFHGLELLFGAPQGANRWLRLAGVFPSILGVAFFGAYLVKLVGGRRGYARSLMG